MLNMWPGCNDAGDDDADTEDVTRMPQEPVEIRYRNDDGSVLTVTMMVMVQTYTVPGPVDRR